MQAATLNDRAITGMAFRFRSIGEFVRWLREKKELTVRAFAEEHDTSYPNIAEIERDKFMFPAAFCKRLYPTLTAEEKKAMIDAISISIQEYLEDDRPRSMDDEKKSKR